MKFLLNRSRRWKIIAIWILCIILVIVSVFAIPGPSKFFISGVFCTYILTLVVVGLQFTIFARFIDPDHFPFSAFFLCAGAYFFSFGSVILLSLDLGYTLYYRQKNDAHDQRTLQYVLIILWNIFYWGKLIFGTLLVKFYQQYWRTGHFSTCSRVKQALKMLLIPIIIIAVLVIVCLIFVYSLITTELLLGAKMVLIGLSHIYNFTILIILLGFGLLSFPISLWSASNFSYILYSKVQIAARYYRQFRDAYIQFYTNVNTIRSVVEEIAPTDPAYDFVDILESELPQKDQDGFQIGASRSRTFELKKGQEYTENILAKLRQKFKVSFFLYKRKRAKWVNVSISTHYQLINEVERVMKPKSLCNDEKEEVARLNVLRAAHSISEDTQESNTEFKTYTPQIYPRKPSTFYKCWTKLLAVVFFLLSLGVIFAETTLMFDQTLSPFYQILHHVASIYMTVVLSLVCLSYLFFISFFTFFRFQLSDFYQMVPFHTDSLTLSFNASQCAKIAPVICYNFLSLVKEINYPSDLYGTAFDDFYSKSINNIPFLGTIYSFAIPILVIILALVSLLCLSKRISKKVQKKFKRFSKKKVGQQKQKQLSYVEKMEQGEKEIFKELDRRNRERTRKATEQHNQSKREQLNQKKSQKLLQEERSYRRATLQNTELSQQMIDYNAAQIERDLDFANQVTTPEFESISAQLANFGSKKKAKKEKRKSKQKEIEEATVEMPENALNAFMKQGRVESLQEEIKQEAGFNKRRESMDSQSSRKSVDHFSGFLYKRSSKKFTLQKWKKKYCVLKDFFLCLYDNQEAILPLKQIDLSQALAIDKHYSENAMVKSKKIGASKLDLTRFDIVLPTHHFKFRSDSISQTEEWISQLLKARERGKRRQFA